MHPFASVAVTVYSPAVSPFAEAVMIPEGFQEKPKAPVPPEATAVADPVIPPLQATFVEAGIESVIAVG